MKTSPSRKVLPPFFRRRAMVAQAFDRLSMNVWTEVENAIRAKRDRNVAEALEAQKPRIVAAGAHPPPDPTRRH